MTHQMSLRCSWVGVGLQAPAPDLEPLETEHRYRYLLHSPRCPPPRWVPDLDLDNLDMYERQIQQGLASACNHQYIVITGFLCHL